MYPKYHPELHDRTRIAVLDQEELLLGILVTAKEPMIKLMVIGNFYNLILLGIRLYNRLIYLKGLRCQMELGHEIVSPVVAIEQVNEKVATPNHNSHMSLSLHMLLILAHKIRRLIDLGARAEVDKILYNWNTHIRNRILLRAVNLSLI